MKFYTCVIALLCLAAVGLLADQQVGTAGSGQSSSAGRQLQSIVGQTAGGTNGGLLTETQLRNYVPGDADGSRLVNISDAVSLVAYIFAGGVEPYPLIAGDADCDGIVNISDATKLISYIFGGSSEPGFCN